MNTAHETDGGQPEMSLEKHEPECRVSSSSEKQVGSQDNGSSKEVVVPQAVPINNTWWRRNLSRLAIHATRMLTKRDRHSGGVLRLLGGRLCVKYHPFLTLADAATLHFVAQHTSIPVPKVYCAFERKGLVYIVMGWIKGKNAGDGWYHQSEESKAKIL